MYQNIKEIRWAMGLSQKAFAELYGIPISTLRNREQGSNLSVPYVIRLIVRTLPCINSTLKEIQGKNGRLYYYDKNQNYVLDIRGNRIYARENLKDVKKISFGVKGA